MAGNDGVSFATNTVETNKEENIEIGNACLTEAETTHTNTTLGQGGRGHAPGHNGGRGANHHELKLRKFPYHQQSNNITRRSC